VLAGWRRLHYEKLYHADEINEDMIGETCSTHGSDEKYIILVG
jgi:hypothetical protein